MKQAVIIALNATWNIYNFRLGLVRALIEQGYVVIAAAPRDEYVEKLVSETGCQYVQVDMDNKGVNPIKDFLLFLRYLAVFYRYRPDYLLAYTIKPNIYGTVAAKIIGVKVINTVAGLGATFIRQNWLTRVVKRLYKIAFSLSDQVVFQNAEDRNQFVEQNLVKPGKTSLVAGSGIDLNKFRPTEVNHINSSGTHQPAQNPLTFLLVARMLWDKGVGEFVEAARIVKERHPATRFCLLGYLDSQNPAALSREDMDGWVKEGVVEYLGVRDDVRAELSVADCLVLPSYREGAPRTLLEGAAMAKPLIATDTIGCRDVVIDGYNGFLCRVRSSEDLASAMVRMIKLSPEDRETFGRNARALVENNYDEKGVISHYVNMLSLC